MASTYAVPPASFRNGQASEPSNSSPPNNSQLRPNVTSFDPSHLSPSSQYQSSSLSPTCGETPAESVSNFSQYQSSDYSDIDDGLDPFFGVSFNTMEAGTPSFLDSSTRADSFDQSVISQAFGSSQPRSNALEAKIYPLTPDQASLHTASPGCDRSATTRSVPGRMPTSISPQELQKPFQPHPISTSAMQPAPQLTPNTSGSGRSSEDSAVPSPAMMTAQSPRVTVSMWGRDTSVPAQSIERTFTHDDEKPSTAHGGISSAGDLVFSQEPAATGPPQRRSSVTRHGLDPDSRPSTEIASVNEMVTRREIEEKNQEVDQWLSHSLDNIPVEAPPSQAANLHTSPEPIAGDDNIRFGDRTENRYQPGQTYFTARGGEMTATDLHIMHSNRVWGDSPLSHPISGPGAERYQPETSQAAMARFRQMCDNQSIVSKAATWGTRRRSLPSVMDMDIENVTSGSLLKKLSISRGESGRRPSILKDLRGLVSRSGSQRLKRSNSTHGDDNIKSEPSPPEKRESLPHLLPSARTGSWGKPKTQTPSINTALVSMGSRVASIGTTHARNGSIGGATVTSPKSPLSPFTGLQVKNTLRRPRSKSDLPKASAAETHSNLVGMWRKTGGPPVPVLAKGNSTNIDVDDDDEDEDEPYEDGDMNAESSKLIEGVSPNFAGFQQHVLRLNPDLATTNNYLVDRIAHQQVVRYKSLLNAKVKHLGLGTSCSCGAFCLASGGRSVLLDQRGDLRDLDPLSTGHDFGEGDSTPVEGAITKDSFPRDIPMPPTQSLPAEFECQLCFTLKKPKKPSDWTKHVHEDVQPFTCTWDRCREPKIFKRKADWVRHENEGHRHLEWWTCDVEDCRHTCYRRDNFLQHLVREHKFIEPKNKTKAAIKKAGAVDPTWQKVEQCRHETSKKPQEEPCRFCGKQFPTWKKLTVHLAKHMEHISLPILRLVAAKELEPDTIISPVQDPPPRAPFTREPSDEAFIKSERSRVSNFAQPSTYQPQGIMPLGNGPHHGANQFGYAGATGNLQFQDYMYSSQLPNGQPVAQNMMGMPPVNQAPQGFNQQYHNANGLAMPASSYMGTQQHYMPGAQDTEPFPSLDHNALGLHQPDVMSVSMGYDGLMGTGNLNENHYTSQGSISPYSQSPLQDGLGFYPAR
ncbi:C2H2 finger domain-containing protein [Colletotrichum sublineola]|uniref:Putative C2H2 finger domain-containing protein n=1 Tax=Colletotrichum sublineola TaxID=1173701 RepID=A0A066X3K5_COLSU|nr:C2H2 finger domain-containing protein [Colletotrichum sublineola]KDN62249.1 putative C2H2 finger domain-containing protein [Colletotrichum sublineola]